MIKLSKIIKDLETFNAQLHGEDLEIKEVSPIENSHEQSLCYINSEKFLTKLKESNAKAFVVPNKIIDKVKEETESISIISCDLPELFIAKVLHQYYTVPKKDSLQISSIHKTCVIAETSTVDPSTNIGPNVVIGENCKIGKNVLISPNCVISDNVEIKDNCVLHSQVHVGKNTLIGKNCNIGSHCSIGLNENSMNETKCIIEDNVDFGSHCIVRSGSKTTLIQTGTKFDNNVFIGANVNLGPHSLLTAGNQVLDNCVIGHHFIAGGNALVEKDTHICEQVLLGGLSYVTENIEKPGQYGGNPLLPMREYLKLTSTIHHLPKIRRELSKK